MYGKLLKPRQSFRITLYCPNSVPTVRIHFTFQPLTLTFDSRVSAYVSRWLVSTFCARYQASLAARLRSSIFWDFARRRLAVRHRRIVPTFSARAVHKLPNNLHHATRQNRGNLNISYCSDVCLVPRGGTGV